jgi:hypothetical protein
VLRLLHIDSVAPQHQIIPRIIRHAFWYEKLHRDLYLFTIGRENEMLASRAVSINRAIKNP